ncbi:MAG: DNA-binding protein [Bacteroidetes bacterium]|jgi:excisionase family DNA binding protein|nr:DNA-binding protein [Bacteroidota bacterium]
MGNPFEQIDQRLSNIEYLLLDLKHKSLSTNIPSEQTIEYLTRKQASKFLQISLPKLDEFTRAGDLPAARIGTRVRYLKTDLVNSLVKIKGAKVA